MKKAPREAAANPGQLPAATASAPATAQPDPVAEAKERKVQPAEAVRFKSTEFVWTRYALTANAGVTPQDMLAPEYWAHIAAQLKPRDEVVAWADDGTWRAEFVVLGSDRNWARVHLVGVSHFTSADVAQTLADQLSPYEISHRGPHSKWSVIRKSDRMVVAEGYDTARQATEWLEGRMKAER